MQILSFFFGLLCLAAMADGSGAAAIVLGLASWITYEAGKPTVYDEVGKVYKRRKRWWE